MKLANNSLKKLAGLACLVAAILVAGISVPAQSPQLSLADLLIGLRSKKLTLPERNTILTEAVRQRGVTFAITPEIEKELETTGAAPTLIEAIRQKAPVVKPAATPAVVKPAATPADIVIPRIRAIQRTVDIATSRPVSAKYRSSFCRRNGSSPSHCTCFSIKCF